jgi:hypothetical protein
MKLLLSVGIAGLLANVAVAQPASVQLINTSCATPEGVAGMQTVGLPQLGATIDFVYSGPNHFTDASQTITQPWLVLGLSAAGPVPVPPWLPAQPPGCTLLPAADLIVPMPWPDPLQFPYATQFPDTFSIAVPNAPGLIGAPFLAQWLAMHTQCGFAGCDPLPLWIGTSATAFCIIGT